MNKALLVIDVQQFFINKYTKDIPQKIAGRKVLIASKDINK